MKSFPKSKTERFYSWFQTVNFSLIVKTVLYIQWKNLPKKDSANSMAREHVFLQSVVVSSEPRFLEDRRKVPWNWDFSLFINEQWIGEKEIPNSNMIYQWSFRIPFFRIISSCMYRKHVYLLRLMDNPFHKFCSIFVC